MKKTFLVLGAVVMLMASFSKSNSKVKEGIKPTANYAVENYNFQADGEKLISKADCMGCHHKTKKIIGPAYEAIAKKYPSNEKNINYLVDKVIKGGTGVWGQLPMTPHPTLKKADAKLMVTYILSLKK